MLQSFQSELVLPRESGMDLLHKGLSVRETGEMDQQTMLSLDGEHDQCRSVGERSGYASDGCHMQRQRGGVGMRRNLQAGERGVEH